MGHSVRAAPGIDTNKDASNVVRLPKLPPSLREPLVPRQTGQVAVRLRLPALAVARLRRVADTRQTRRLALSRPAPRSSRLTPSGRQSVPLLVGVAVPLGRP